MTILYLNIAVCIILRKRALEGVLLFFGSF